MALDLRDLAVFLAVEREGSFGRAAGELLVTQPAVSERIRQLERVVGRPVFERSARGVVLTPTGEALLPYARRCVALADEALEQARAADGVPRFVMVVHSTFAPRVVPFALGALRTLPRRVAVRDAHSEDVVALVADGGAHVGFAIPGPRVKGLTRLPLRPDPVACIAAPEHALSRTRTPGPKDLVDSLIAVNAWGDGWDAFLERVRRAGTEEWRVRFCGDAATAIALARDHRHVAFVAHAAVPDDAGLRRVPLTGLGTWKVHLDLVHRTRDRETPEIEALLAAAGDA
jgi:DNA-binding transcriptional LysR family regulator